MGSVDKIEKEEELILEKIEEDEKENKFAFVVMGVLIIALFSGMLYLFTLLNKSQKNVYMLDQNTQKKTKSLVSPAASSTTSPTPTTKVQSPVVQSPVTDSGVKEYFISFGSGSSQASDWTDVSGLTATVDFGSYQNIKEIRFEASVNVPTANQVVYVRLFNKSDQHPVWYSEVSMTGPSSYLISNPIIYDTGSKIYQVQMKTQLQFLASLPQSRLHILLK